MTRIIVEIIKIYQKAFKGLPPVCRFSPSCSQYTIEALEKYGLYKGGLMAAKRIIRCHPFSAGGEDPVK